MKVVILCGGMGTRLREETEFRPKPMVHIGTRPILWHIMKIYAHFGHNDFIIALGYKGDMIKDYFCRYEIMNNDVTLELGKPESLCLHQKHNEVGWKVTLTDTGEAALKGARVKRIEKYISDDTFMVTYGDGLADLDINKLISFHKRHGKIATLTGVNPASRFGELKYTGNRVESFSEKPVLSDRDEEQGLISGGFFVFDRRIFDYVSEDDDCDLEYGVLEQLAREGQLMVYKHKGFWACMDTLRDMEFLNEIWMEGKPQWKVWA